LASNGMSNKEPFNTIIMVIKDTTFILYFP
jgi:hypothetical protein